jgi:hypothetical protein
VELSRPGSIRAGRQLLTVERARSGFCCRSRCAVVPVEQQCCGGLNFGYFYDQSPIIASDGEQARPPIRWAHSPRARCPAAACRTSVSKGGAHRHDEAGLYATAPGPTTHVAGIVAAAAQRGLPLGVLDVRSRDALKLLATSSCWRARTSREPAYPLDLVGLVRAPRGSRWQNGIERRRTFFNEAARRGRASARPQFRSRNQARKIETAYFWVAPSMPSALKKDSFQFSGLRWTMPFL